MTDLREILLSLSKELFSYMNEIRRDPDSSRIVGYHAGDTSRIADREIETFISQYFSKSGLKVKMVTEESGIIDPGNAEYIAVVDPLDGSSNFVMGIPWYSVSIAMFDADSSSLRESKAGIVANLTTGKTYSYDEEKAYVEGKTPVDSPNTVLAYYDIDQIDEAVEIMSKVKRPFKVRTLGSASLDMSLVCEGMASLYFDIRTKLRNVDIAASTNFCTRMGYRVVDDEENPINATISDVVRIKNWVIVTKKE
ncbi:inositol monophosphatase family protein [Sulfuracidifex tepidarius]|uniref:Fructose-1,6-bisphosphatase/inositol-1-monophosphatase n=1 Tax=Sulfuracidifex tepidarius TaxID=1294262 RepID=A0A510DYK3_9CREN|nr:inositol monophosphatase family protein [Sulfuracidifex tepidarius]BBG25259.1 Fructose-1,6-bisphosphatase/inositol-1-monophosphatase [Sulfuracidifex tepidarius]BBG28053.1 Fructose-1,6-bisphosphatase/inositol-1-monophosphatase [Sulfuracidifex tepidarius]